MTLDCFPFLNIKIRQQGKSVIYASQNTRKKNFSEYESLKDLLADIAISCDVEFDQDHTIQEAWMSFFLLRSNAPVINLEQMNYFLQTFFGLEKGQKLSCKEFLEQERLSESELKSLYKIGYNQFAITVKNYIKQLQLFLEQQQASPEFPVLKKIVSKSSEE